MASSKNVLLLQGANLAAFLATVAVNALSNVLPMNGKNVGEISDLYPNLFTPAAYVFSIWGIIYAFLFAFAIYQALPQNREKIFLHRISGLFVLSSIANIVWIFLWLYEQIVLSLIPMFILLTTLIAIYVRLQIGQSKVPLKEKLCVQLPFSTYLGWITVATISNVAAALTAISWDSWGISDTTWTLLMIIVALIVTIAVVSTRKDVAFSLVIIWALGGIIVKQIENQSIVLTASVGAIIIAAALIVRMTILHSGKSHSTVA
jgi:hypothetical protein